jgi:hypothetical protein
LQIISPKKILTPREMELSEHILAKCGGLPEVITAIGKYCRFGYEYKLKNINENFMEILETNVLYFDCLRGLFSWMQCYFEDCKDSLKPCIFYLPVFPTNHNFRRRRLLRRWIAEGYSIDTSSGTAEENGERMFSELVDLSIIQQPSSKSLCRVNGFFHEYITSRPMEDNLVFALEGHCSLNSELVGKHLSIRKSWDRDNNVFGSIDFASLRSLTVFGEWRPIFMSTNVNMRLLRVLDLEDTSNVRDEDIEQIGKLVPRLKFLSLRGCRGITRLPNSFGGLRQLQTLDVRHSSIATLPQAIIKLLKLQYIRVGTSKQPWDEGGRVTSIPTDGASTSQQVAPTQAEEGASTNSSQLASPGVVRASMHSRIRPHRMLSRWLSKLSGKTQHHDNCGVDVPARIGKLTALHTLGVISVSGEGGKAIVMELQTLSRLRRLGLCGINRENFKEFWSAISGHGHLESLSVQVDEDREHGLICCFDDTIAPPPKNLKSLKLYGYVHILPVGWIKQLDNLKMLDLEMTVLRQQDIDVLDELQNRDAICRLCVRLTNEGEIQFRTPINISFHNLEVLEIDCASKFQVTFLPVQQFNYVEVLKVHCSSGSSLQIFGIVNLEYLKNVWLKGSYRDELKEDLRRQLSRNRKHPVLNLVQQCLS